MKRAFRWLPAGALPAACDLRAAAWTLHDVGRWDDDPAEPLLLAIPDALPPVQWSALLHDDPRRLQRTLLCGVAGSSDRSRLLALGFGDVVGEDFDRVELAQRAGRIVQAAGLVPRCREFGPLTLDLVERQAFCRGVSVGLHPREFALLWRLADTPGSALDADALLRDVWHLTFRPETNSLAVHVSRLRTKLRLAGLDGLIETLHSGGYRLAAAEAGASALPFPGLPQLPLDAHVRLGKVGERETMDHADEARIEA